MRRRRHHSVSPIYVFALVYLGISLFWPLLTLGAVLIGLGLAAGAAIASAGAVTRFFRSRRERRKAREEAEAAAEKAAADAIADALGETPPSAAETPVKKDEKETRYSEQVNEIINDGRMAMKEMGRLYGSIRNDAVRGKINEIMAVSDKIVRDAIDDESDAPQIRRFLDFYLPTTIKLLNAYDRMDSQEIEGETISGSKQSIEEMLDTTIDAYKKQLDALFKNQAMDIEAEIRAMNGMMAREGLTGKGTLDWNEFMKEYEKQKGTTQNG